MTRRALREIETRKQNGRIAAAILFIPV